MPKSQFEPGKMMLSMVAEGDPRQLCRRAVYGTIDGLVVCELHLTTIGQLQVSSFLREVANHFALHEGSIIAGKNGI